MMCYLIFWLFMISVMDSFVENSNCGNKRSCSECIQEIGCVWCIEPLNTTYNAESQIHCIPKNSTISELCKGDTLIDPPTKAKVQVKRPLQSSKGDVIQITPQQLEVNIRKGEEYNFNFQYEQAKDYPVDLYYIMDLSASMENYREKLGALGTKLAETMKNLTANFRIGFGSFVDKVELPFVSTTKSKLESPCTLNKNGRQTHCVPPYSFKNHMSLTDDYGKFTREVSQAQVSGNLDTPEGGFDAIMQAIVCEEQIGWRPKARHLLVFSTDAEFHIAGDGKLAGVIEPNDAKCHMKNNFYTDYLIYDYPSVSQINYVAKEKNVNMIFAIVKKYKSVVTSYERLSENIENSNFGELEENSTNVINLVVENYNKIVDTVIIDTYSTKDVEVKISSTCANPRESGCSKIHVGEIVNFTATIKLLDCPDNVSSPLVISLKPRTIAENITINLNTICSCDCANPGSKDYEAESKNCSMFGNLECGVCKCDKWHFGTNCECNEKNSHKNNETDCIAKNSTEVCSGAGACACGKCECNSRMNQNERIFGKYCQCDNYSCDRVNRTLCSGHGTCDCGSCICEEDWSGSACECSNNNVTCINEAINGNVCTGHGNCICGKCKCSNEYEGVFCEKLPNYSGRCEDVLDCLKCLEFKEENYKSNRCTLKCTGYLLEFVERITEDDTQKVAKICRGLDADCNYIFSYQYKEKDSQALIIKIQKHKVCPPNIFAWIFGVIGSIVLAGLIMLIIWKVLTTIHDKKEYVKFENERKSSKWHRNQNPLYKDATTTFQNPYYTTNNSASTESS